MSVANLPRAAVTRVRALTGAHGARTSGLAQLIELHAVHSAGDALIAVSLAGTLFFSVPVGQARGRVALYLLVTMAPFALVAPVVGPALDRLRHGRRWALAATMLGRAALAWGMAHTAGGLQLYPAAFGVLVLSKAYGVSRSAVVPRLLPRAVTLVSANARLSLSGLVLAAVAAPVGAGLSAAFGYRWCLRLAIVCFLVAGVLALRLPARVDSTEQRRPGRMRRADRPEPVALPRLKAAAPAVVVALRAAASLRVLGGFLTLFLAFLLRGKGGANIEIALLVVAAGLGGLAGTCLGAALPERAADAVLTTVLLGATAACVFGALVWSVPAALVVALVASFAGALAKLVLDAVLQQEVAEDVRSSAFARSETLLQLSWVAGGALGIALPLDGRLGFGIAAAGMCGALVLTVRSWWRRRSRRPAAGRRTTGERSTTDGPGAPGGRRPAEPTRAG
ncbi:MAG: MFS transporter [Actinomycetota bacterium]|nr:MFS transporter [Actinomycetota bacterium]